MVLADLHQELRQRMEDAERRHILLQDCGIPQMPDDVDGENTED